MKLIHTADLHLDSPFSGFSSDQARKMRADLLENFCRMVDFAEANDICAILIAGDLFDSASQIRKGTVKTILNLIADHRKIHFYYLAGNHDGGANAFANEQPLSNLHFFADGWTSYEQEGIVFTGAKKPDPDKLALDPQSANLLLLHGQVADAFSTTVADGIPLRAYAGKGIDYLALGHIHSFAEYRVDDRCFACYSGTPMGRGFDECGPKGFVLLDVTPGERVKYEFYPFAKRILLEVRTDISGCSSQTELERRVRETLEQLPPNVAMLKLTICGEQDPDFEPDTHPIERYLESNFDVWRLKDESVLQIRPEDYQSDKSLKGEFIRLVQSEESLSPAERDRVIRTGLQALYGRKEIDL